MFELPLKEIAAMVGRTPAATKQLASRARRRVSGASVPAPDDPTRQREVVDAFFAAARRGDFDALVALLHPGIVARADFGAHRPAASILIRGADTVARQAILGGARPGAHLHPVRVNTAPGVVVTVRGRPFAVMSFTIADNKIIGIDTIADPERVRMIATELLTAQ